MNILRRVTIRLIGAFCAALVLDSITIFSSQALAQTYPTKPIRIVVTNEPGSGTDTIARLIGSKLTESLGQQIIVDNRAGADGRIGAEIAAKAAPDGYTLLLISATQTIANARYKDLKYNLVKDFSPIGLIGTVSYLFVVTPSLQVNSIKELVTQAKSRPGVLKYGSQGYGGAMQLQTEIFKFMTGTNILHVPYKSAPAALTATMVGEVDMCSQTPPACLPMIRSGKLRALGITSPKRTSLLPDVPSISESVPGYEFFSFYGLIAPAKTSPAILSKLNTELIKALNTSELRERMTGLAVDALGSSQKEFALFLSEQLEKMKEAVKLSGAGSIN